ncbi:hypothetical protein NQ176_g8132 [Zarea fungicola]|uniref:Uncharacterized protein n=1 Tax=Zarea fungicola TaxID=93591 RepID=A0ACC1MUQ7_9HYPO|nr:hypothetical protein NQ176_g8132 [Lecanicillium fungicola]
MELLELVEYEPATRPFQCDWGMCYKSSSLARHRRIHTGKRPYKCAHDGCLKSFCRRATMAKHQRRSHQQGLNSHEMMDYGSTDSDMCQSPSTPSQSNMSWHVPGAIVPGQAVSQGSHMIHRAAPFSDLNQQMHQRSMQTVGESSIQQHPATIQRAQSTSIPQQPFYVLEPRHQGEATMNTNIHTQSFQVPRSPVEHQNNQVELAYNTTREPPNAGNSLYARSKDATKAFWKYHGESVLAKYGDRFKIGTVAESAKL